MEYFQAERKTDGVLAAAKIIDVKDESELDDFMVEIDILSECKHKHVVGMYEAYYHENKLWVSNQSIVNFSGLLASVYHIARFLLSTTLLLEWHCLF